MSAALDVIHRWMRLAGWGPEHPLLHVTALIVLAITAVTVLTMFYVLMFSARARRAQRSRLLFDKVWRPRMAAASIEEAIPDMRAPRRARERLWWLMLWNRMQRQLRGQSRVRLNAMLRFLGMERHAGRLLRGLNVRHRLVALEALRHLGDEGWWPSVAPLCRNRNRYIGLAAAHALLEMDPRRGLAFALEVARARDDWSARQLADLCHSAGVEPCTAVLLEALDKADAAAMVTLAGLVEFADPGAMQTWAQRMLAGEAHAAVLHAALKVLGELGDPRDHGRIAAYLQHGDARLRLAALRALRKQARRSDIPHFMVCLIDRAFSIRSEAAEAIATVPGLTAQEAARILSRIEDPYGRDQLKRALNARNIAGRREGEA